MPDPSLSDAIKEAYASAPDDEVILHTIEMRHASFISPIRVVRDFADHTLTLEATAPLNPGAAVLFVGFAFDFQLPEVAQQGVPELILTVDNVSAEIEEALAGAAESNTRVEITYRQYLLSDTTEPQNNPPLNMTLLSAQAKGLSVVGRATLADIANKLFPGEDYTSVRFPGLIT